MRIVAESLALARGERTVIAELSFSISAGEALLVTGANGSGKTTLLRALAGFLKPFRGAIEVSGGNAEQTLGEQCHYIGHGDGLRASLTVRENLSFWNQYLGGTPERLRNAMAAMAVADFADVTVSYLSAGQRRRAGLARLLVAARPVWLLDEPTTSLDAASADRVTGIATLHVEGGGIIIAATHTPFAITGAREMRLDQRAMAAV